MRQKLFIGYIGIAVCILCGILFVGCSTIINTSSQKIGVKTRPSAAAIKVYDSAGGLIKEATTPCDIVLNRGNGYFTPATYKVVISAPGFQEVTIRIGARVSMWYAAGNFLGATIIGWLIVDPLTGGMWELEPDPINTNLDALESSVADGNIHICLMPRFESNPETAARYLGRIPVSHE